MQAQIVRRASDLLAAAEGLTTEAYRLGSMDNISAVVVRLNYRGPLSLSQRASTAVRTLSQRGVRQPRPPGPPANALTLALTQEDKEFYAQQAAAAANSTAKPRRPAVRFSDGEPDAAHSGYVSSDVAATAGMSANMNGRTLPVTDSAALGSTASSDIPGSSAPVWSGTIGPGRAQHAAQPQQEHDAGAHVVHNGAAAVPQQYGAEQQQQHLTRMSPVVEEAHSSTPQQSHGSAHAQERPQRSATAPMHVPRHLQRPQLSLPNIAQRPLPRDQALREGPPIAATAPVPA